MTTRELDVLLWGATGFTGALVAEYLLGHHPNLRIGLGGRNPEKLEAVKRSLAGFVDPKVVERAVVVVGDPASKDEMAKVARRAKVVASTAGPFAAYGRELVRACAEQGTHYADITGEVTFVRFAIDELDAIAKKTGARIVSCCGFDSIPSDLGVLVAHETLVRAKSPLRAAELCVVSMSGKVSGGTAASMMLLMSEAARDRNVRRLLADPYGLCPSRPRSPVRERNEATYDRDLGKWTAPFVMRAINSRVVHRTNALLGGAYGEDFRYDERVAVGAGPLGHARASAMALGFGVGPALLAFDPLRKMAERRMPKPGEGPSREERDRGKFTIRVTGVGAHGERVVVTVKGEKDPGYGETAKMLGEAAVALSLGTGLPERSGVLTPATGMGMALVERLRRAGMTFDVTT